MILREVKRGCGINFCSYTAGAVGIKTWLSPCIEERSIYRVLHYIAKELVEFWVSQWEKEL